MEVSQGVIEGLDLNDVLSGLPPSGSWRRLIEIGSSEFGLSCDGATAYVVPVTRINDSWDFEFALTEADWAA
jgi:hypothetical protein